ncbi:unnamed protein product [Amoebophrya sp. A25]|nr:unnamed protein product [Amoebophrya sp. A25]|eukprot:GSA25T00007507001.1
MISTSNLKNLRHQGSQVSKKRNENSARRRWRYLADPQNDARIIRQMSLGSRWENVLTEPIETGGCLTARKIETIAALRIQSQWRCRMVRSRAVEHELANTPKSKIYSVEMVQLRLAIYRLFEDAQSSKAAKTVSLVILAVIIFSIASLVAETSPSFMPDVDKYGVELPNQSKGLVIHKDVWLAVDWFCTLVFSVEFALRLWVCNVLPDKTVRGFLTQPMNICDLLAIAPLYIEVLFQGGGAGFLRILRAIRLVRLFRIFKLGRYSTALQLMFHAIFDSIQILLVLLFFLAIGVILFSSVIYYFEKLSCPDKETGGKGPGGKWNEEDWTTYVSECEASTGGKFYSSTYGLCCDQHDTSLDFPNILTAVWWNVVTMTTVGYGDIVPRTPQGQVVASLALLAGILLIALPVAVVGRKFQETYDQLESDKAIASVEGHMQSFASKDGNYSDPEELPFTKLVASIQALETEDTDFFLKLKNLQRLIDQCIAANAMVHRLQAAEKVRQQTLYFTLQKILTRFLREN